MNICFLTAEVPNLRSGGVENVTYRLVRGLSEKGHSVHCLTFDSYNICGGGNLACLSIGYDGDATKIVENYIRDNDIDVIINQVVNVRWQLLLNALKPKFPSIRFIKVLHTDPAYLTKGVTDSQPLYHQAGSLSRLFYALNPITLVRRHRRAKYAQALYGEWVDFYDQVVLLSDKVIDDFKHIAGRPYATNVTAISNPIDFVNAEHFSQKENIVLYVGRMHKEAKRPDRLVAVWKKLYRKFPKWKLVFVGDGPLRGELVDYCQHNNIERIEFVGKTDPIPYYKKASICCVTSTYEGFSLVCAEALSNYIVPIAFDSYGAVKDLIEDGVNGLLVKPYSIDAYCKALTKLMSDEKYLNSLRENICEDLDFKKRLAMDNIIRQWEELFNRLQSCESSIQ